MSLSPMRTLADLADRCTIDPDTGCWTWNGARERHAGAAPSIWIRGVGATSLQVALPMLALGRRAAPGVRYVPTCGFMHCMNCEHRREGTLSELMTLAAQVYADRRNGAIRAAGERIREGLAAFHERRRAERLAAAAAAPKPAPKPKAKTAGKKAKPKQAGPKLHDISDSMGRPGVMPQSFAAGLRKPGSNARPIPALRRPEPTEPRITSRTKVTICPSGRDHRYTVHELPPGHRSALDPRECRAWASAAAGAGASS